MSRRKESSENNKGKQVRGTDEKRLGEQTEKNRLEKKTVQKRLKKQRKRASETS